MPSASAAGGKKRVQFQIKADAGSEVYVAGTFNGWNPKKNKLKSGKGGTYATSLMLPAGRHEYKFIIDGTWCVDPECPEWAPNGLGSLNSVITVG
ncbi:MAG: isoamylase early set domain-containing protein [Kiritimatiellae bacterium]|nr:isoamylase early set domain-containing protein [Kiritimatiellia bacterium]